MNIGGDRKVVFALLGIGMLCLIGLGGSLYHAKASKLSELQQTLTQKEAELDETKTKVQELPQLEERYQDLRQRLSVLEPSLPDSAYIPTFLRQIENLATGTRNEILLIRPKPAIKKSAADTVKINDETGEIVKNERGSTKEKEAPPPSMPYDFVPIEIRLQGSYWTVIGFLQELQRFPKMIAVNDISFSPNQGGVGAGISPTLTASMELTAVVTKGGSDGGSA